ncbi:hypothetical protein [Larkinella rosea]|uniref:Uncharacterized protein n=1 Tax=Larkinella rosea TaxID=2025312 RepID=A0A3P1C2X4_9BACT|nr:hypothetical protein [Larkinella rosea]RRB07735.1 hypothetical protein EHT25_08165 [Larkinella rosea]
MKGEKFFIDDNRVPAEFSAKRFGRFLTSEQSQRQKEEARLERALHTLQEKYRAEEMKLIGSEMREKLTEYTRKNRRPDPKPGEDSRLLESGFLAEERCRQRIQSLRFAQDVKLDLNGLVKLRRAASLEFEKLIKPVESATHRTTVEQPEQAVFNEPFVLPHPNPLVSEATFFPNYPGWWDRSAQNSASGDGQIKRNDSYLWWDASRSGSCIHSKNKDAGDFDYLMSHRENGFLVPFKTTQNGILRIRFDVECAFSQHCLETWDEWGWSDYTAWTNEAAVASVFWKWEDVTPATESVDLHFVWGLDGHGDGESSPGVVYPVPAAQLRTLTVYTNMSFPANVNLWIYIGTKQRFYGIINDVSINTFVNAGWYIRRIQVNSI